MSGQKLLFLWRLAVAQTRMSDWFVFEIVLVDAGRHDNEDLGSE